MNQRVRRGWSGKRVAQLLLAPLVGAALGFAGFFISVSDPWQFVELKLLDYGYRLKASPDHPSSVVFVAVDEEALASYSEPMTEWGSRFAAAIQRLERLDASAIGLDFLMPNPLPPDRSHHDRNLAMAVRNSDHVVLSSLWKGTPGAPAQHVLPKPLLWQGAPDPQLRVGFVNQASDVDGCVRRSHLYLKAEEQTDYSFSLLLAAKHLKAKPAIEDQTVRLGDARSLCTDDDGAIRLSYDRNPIDTEVIRLTDLVDPNTPDEVLLPKVRGRVAIIGPGFAESQDYHSTPFGNEVAGPLLVVAAVQTILDGDPPATASRELLLATFLLVGVTHGVLVWWMRRIGKLVPFSVVAALLLAAATPLSLAWFNIVLPGAALGVVLLVTYGCRLLPFPHGYDAFISYRRQTDASTAMLIRDRLAAYRIRVFLDVDEVDEPTFGLQLRDEIQRARCFIIVLSKETLERCAKKDDWVRQEIACALQSGRRIVPVLIKDFKFPERDELPDEINGLADFHGLSYSHEHAGETFSKLARLTAVGPLRRVKLAGK